MKATITSKGQITIPVVIRKKLKLDSGTVLDFDEHTDHLHAEVVQRQVPIHRLIGIAEDRFKGKSALKWLEQTRGAVKLPPERRRR